MSQMIKVDSMVRAGHSLDRNNEVFIISARQFECQRRGWKPDRACFGDDFALKQEA